MVNIGEICTQGRQGKYKNVAVACRCHYSTTFAYVNTAIYTFIYFRYWWENLKMKLILGGVVLTIVIIIIVIIVVEVKKDDGGSDVVPTKQTIPNGN